MVLGSAANLIDPVTNRFKRWTATLKSWRDRALFLTSSPTAGELIELRANTWMTVTIGTIEEIGRVAQAVDFGGANCVSLDDLSFSEPRYRDLTSIERLSQGLGPVIFRWLCACALHHQLSCSITIRLSRLKEMFHVPPNELTMFTMFRLPWFRTGALPPGLRAQLSGKLPKDVELAARKAIIELLKSSAPRRRPTLELLRSWILRLTRQ
jgi:hypothetical protein